VLPTPLFDPNGPRNARNRQNWYIGSPRPFPDGKHILFEGASSNPFEQFGNTIGISPIEGGIVRAAVAAGVKVVRTPDMHPDGETIVFSSCDELRIGKLKGREDQEFETTRLVQLPKLPTAAPTVCTVHRPRFSHDGKQIIFEGVGKFVTDEFKKQYSVPDSVNPGDYVMEPWIVSTDGSGLHRVISDEAYKMIAGRPQTGGSRDPIFSPDGTRFAFAHGASIAVGTIDGLQARLVARHAVATKDGVATMSFDEDDPTFSPDGKTIISASRLGDKDLAPPGFSVIDLAKIDATAAVPEPILDPAKAPPPPTAPHPE
jgi:Tol biopolymer transport system component